MKNPVCRFYMLRFEWTKRGQVRQGEFYFVFKNYNPYFEFKMIAWYEMAK